MYYNKNIILYLNRFRGKPAIPSLFGLSPLITIHLSILHIHEFGPQQKKAFASNKKKSICNQQKYFVFNRIKIRSLGFGSYFNNFCIISYLIFLCLPIKNLSLLLKYTNIPIMQKVQCYI